ncbi:MAG: hypothetical protein LUQ09_04525 [Methanomassiliicoccales archaeon]|nr:hypothetical protein [Methanomassiliicoccales archaeon]
MKVPLLITRLGIIAFKLIVALIVIFSILPLINGGLNVDIDETDDGQSSMDANSMRYDFPITITNNGIYDINDVTISFTIVDDDGNELVRGSTGNVDVPVGSEVELDFRMTINIDDLEDVKMEMVFNGTDLTMNLDVSAKYTMDLVNVGFQADTELTIGPFITNIQVHTYSVNLESEGSEHFMIVPYSFSCADMATGQDASVHTELSDNNGTMGNVTQQIELQSYTYDQTRVPITQEAYDRLIMGEYVNVAFSVNFLDCTSTVNGQFYYGGGSP